MKRLFGLVLMLVALNVSAMNINPTISGSWNNPNQNYHGLQVATYSDEITIVYWYVYDTDRNPLWLLTVGENQGNRTTGTTYRYTGMKFGEFDPNDVQETVWGTSTITFTDCSNATLQYSSNDPAYGSGSIPMSRLASIEGIKCRDNPIQNTYHMTLFVGETAAFGSLWIFESGYASFFAISEYGGVSGIGQATVTGSDRFEMDFTSFDLFGGGWEDEFASGEYSEGFVSANFDGGSMVGTSIHNFQQSISYSSVADVYDIHDMATNQIIGSLTLDSQGNVNGNTFSGCSITGWYTIPDTQFNQLYTEIDLAGCSMNPAMRGAGNVGKDVIGLAMTDYYNGQVWTLKK